VKKFQLTRQTGILIGAAVVAIVLVCLLLFLPDKAKKDDNDIGQTPEVAVEEQTQIDEDVVSDEPATETSADDESVETSSEKSDSDASTNKQEVPKDSSTSDKSTSTVTPEPVPAPQKKEPTITITVDCKTILANPDLLKDNAPNKVGKIPSDGIIFSEKVTFTEGENLLDIFKRAAKASNLKLVTGAGGYISEVGILSEFDCGALSGWLYSVNGTYAGYSSAKYKVEDGDKVAIRYTCDLGKDIGAGGVTQG
jgi:hypothetical protein